MSRTTTLTVTFPLAVKGSNAHPFYKCASLQRSPDTPRWNSHKYRTGGPAISPP